MVTKRILLWIWCFPQNLLGALFVLFVRAKKINEYKECLVYKFKSKFFSGSSLGNFIILEEVYFRRKKELEKTIKHEYGHFLQGCILGPLYLFIIGIPSVLNNLLARKNAKISLDYYHRYPEAWANKLGGVK